MITSVATLGIVICGLSAVRLYFIYAETHNAYHLLLSIASVFGLVSFLSWMNPDWLIASGLSPEIYHFSRALLLASLLSGVSVLIYLNKPEISRFPAFICFLPFIIVFLVPFVINAGMLLEIIFLIYQIAILLILLMLYSNKIDQNGGSILFFLGLIVAASGVVLNWIQGITVEIPIYIIPIPTIIAVIMVLIGFELRFREEGNALDLNSISDDATNEE